VTSTEEVALEELYDRYGHAAYSLARRVVRDASLAEDAVRDAFLAIWRGAARFVPERARAAASIMTHVHRRAEPLQGDAPEARVDASAEDVTWLRLERERVQDALAQLPDQHRETLELAYYGGFTQAQLAGRLGRPLGTIKSQMYAALRTLHALLDASDQEEAWKTS
jgi:RNA polymerase sigma-70 factor, ECF subfamily